MPILNDSLRRQVHDAFAPLPNPVTVLVFGRADCEACDDTRELVEELAAASGGRVRIEPYDLDRDAARAGQLGIDKAPAVAVLGGESGRHDFGIRFFGSPAGYEFGTLIEDIRMASAGVTDLSPDTVDALSRLTTPLHMKVFVTPTCPYCPRAVLLAHKMAVASEMVTADAVDATEFPDLADRYEVRGVPRTIVNETIYLDGAVPERMLMSELLPIVR